MITLERFRVSLFLLTVKWNGVSSAITFSKAQPRGIMCLLVLNFFGSPDVHRPVTRTSAQFEDCLTMSNRPLHLNELALCARTCIKYKVGFLICLPIGGVF